MVLLLGGSGYVGTAFRKFFDAKKIRYFSPPRYTINEIEGLLKNEGVNGVINCIGYTGKPNVDAAEKNKVECLKLNSVFPLELGEMVESLNKRLVHISSGCIYNNNYCVNDRTNILPYSAEDRPDFTFEIGGGSWYSGSKALGEISINGLASSSICRLRIPFNGDVNERNVISKYIQYPKLLNVRNSFSQIDEFVSAAYDTLFAEKGDKAKIYNLTNPGDITTEEIVEMLKKYRLVKHKEYFKDLEEFNATVIAPRSNCTLTNNSINPMTPIREAMETAIKQYRDNVYK